MQWISFCLLVAGLVLLCNIQPDLGCRRRKRPNKHPYFVPECKQSIQATADPGKTGTTVFWPPSKVTARDPDSPHPPSVVLLTTKWASGSYFSGTIPEGTEVKYKAIDGGKAVAYCAFKVYVTVKYCAPVPPLRYGRRSCSGERNNIYGANCTSSCSTGYELRDGAKTVECQTNTLWSGAFPICQPVSCGSPGLVENGQVLCFNGHEYRQRCEIYCNPGFKYEKRLISIMCRKDGTWENLYSCHDQEAPTFPNGCPPDQILKSGPQGSAVPVTWPQPVVTDNSGQVMSLTSTIANGSSLNPGSYTITFTATDSSGNKKSCSFQVDIEEWACQEMEIPHGSVQCSSGYLVGSKCNVTCSAGYQLQGSGTVTCVSSQKGAVWNPSRTFCGVVQCSEPQLSDGYFICPNGLTYPYMCIPVCDQGFRYDGQPYIKCSRNGSWTGLKTCKDVAGPDFPSGCPEDINIYAARLGQATVVTWDDPTVTDNSWEDIQLSSNYPSGSNFSIGVTSVMYIATDPSGNSNRCFFKVTVSTLSCAAPDLEKGKAEKSMTYNCRNSHVYGASCTVNCVRGYSLVGSGNITCERNDQTYPPTMFWDWAGPSSDPPKCHQSTCPDLEEPENGALTCFQGNMGYECLMSCQEGFDVSATLGFDGRYFCTYSTGLWVPPTLLNCLVSNQPNGARVMGDLFYYTNSCDASIEELRQNFIIRINSNDFWRELCLGVSTCTLDKIEVHCGPQTSGRRKREDIFHGDRLDIIDKHHIFRRQSGISTHYILILFEVLINKSGNDSISSQEFYQMCDKVRLNLYTKLRDAVENGTFDEDNMFLPPSRAVGYPQLHPACPVGNVARYHQDRFSCVGCSKGYYLSNTNICKECPVGTYSDIDTGTECTSCPDGLSTLTTAAKNISDCYVQCLEGYKSPDGFEPCQPCPLGQYQPSVGAQHCEQCPINTWTQNVGASSAQQCVNADVMLNNNSVSLNVNSTWSCLTVSLRVRFPDINSTVTVSLHSPLEDSLMASHILSTGYSVADDTWESEQRLFHHFIVKWQDLVPQPPDSTTLRFHSEQRKVLISNLAAYGTILTDQEMRSLGASCTVDIANNLLTWSPAPGSVQVPSVCDAVDECSSSPCGNHGVCVNKLGEYECRCQNGWSGVNCDDPCQQHQCQNDAACMPAADNYTCACSSDYSGVFCELEKVHGGWTQWLPWTKCACGKQQQRWRLCTNPTPENEGDYCNGNDREVRNCSNSGCVPDECSWTSWTEWLNCSAVCDGGETTRQRTCQYADGRNETTFEVQACGTLPCPIHGGWSAWSSWSQCSATCGHGNQTRERTCDNPVPAYGGEACGGSDTDSQDCGTQACPVCSELFRPARSEWKCVTSHSPFFKVCNLICLVPYKQVDPSGPFYCGHNTSYLWNHQLDVWSKVTAPLPVCSRTEILTSGTWNMKIDMNTDCEQSKATEVKYGIQENINNVACQQQSLCQVTMSSECRTSRKRNTPSLQISLRATLDLNITNSDIENNETAWTVYQEQMSVLNQSMPDKDTMESLLTVHLPDGQMIAPESIPDIPGLDPTCAPGMIGLDIVCVECPAGSMEENGTCVQCPLGFYQDQPAATSCKPCPSGMTWKLPGADSLYQCVYPVEEPGTSTTEGPFSTTDKDEEKETVNMYLVIGLVVGLLVIIIVTTIIVICWTTARKKQSLTLHKIPRRNAP